MVTKQKSRRPYDAETRLKAVNDYLNDGRPKCQLELLAIQRQINDLENGHKRGLYWDEQEAQRSVAFFRTLVHWKGHLSGQRFSLPPWQEHGIVTPLLGWYRGTSRKKGGKRRFTTGGIELPKKNGKSTLAAGIGLFGLVADQEQGSEVYSAATQREQASIVFTCAKKMIGSDLKGRGLIKVYVHAIECPPLNGSFKALGSDHNSADGINIHFGIVDELHRHKNRDLWDILVAGTIGRTQPLLFWISTAGWDRASIWYEQHERCRRVLEKPTEENDNTFVFMTGIDEGDDWQDPDIWWKANPNLKIAIDETKFAETMQSAKETPQEENKVRRLHLNQMTEQDVLWIPMLKWDMNSGLMHKHDTISDFIRVKKKWEQELIGEDCYGGLDLASTRDLCSWAKCFPRDNNIFRFLVRYFAPEEAATKRQEDDQRVWQTWAAHELITTTPGSATDYNVIRDVINQDAKKYNIKQVALDPHNAEMFYQQLLTDGWDEEKLFYFYQTQKNYNEGMQRFMELLVEIKLEHGDDPVLRWMANNLVVVPDSNGHIKPDKAKSQNKIDGIVASLMAFTLAIRGGGEDYPQGTYYEEHDLEMA